jgi:hypothetical protein
MAGCGRDNNYPHIGVLEIFAALNADSRVLTTRWGKVQNIHLQVSSCRGEKLAEDVYERIKK